MMATYNNRDSFGMSFVCVQLEHLLWNITAFLSVGDTLKCKIKSILAKKPKKQDASIISQGALCEDALCLSDQRVFVWVIMLKWALFHPTVNCSAPENHSRRKPPWLMSQWSWSWISFIMNEAALDGVADLRQIGGRPVSRRFKWVALSCPNSPRLNSNLPCSWSFYTQMTGSKLTLVSVELGIVMGAPILVLSSMLKKAPWRSKVLCRGETLIFFFFLANKYDLLWKKVTAILDRLLVCLS